MTFPIILTLCIASLLLGAALAVSTCKDVIREYRELARNRGDFDTVRLLNRILRRLGTYKP